MSDDLPRVYLAGPDVFFDDPLALADAKKAICAEHGFTGVFPLDAKLDLDDLAKFDAGIRISEANELLMRSCNLLIANMTPFRGPSMDVGTAFEMGFMRALGKPVFGYSNDASGYVERVARHVAAPLHSTDMGDIRDADGHLVEDFDMPDNLMMIGATVASGLGVVLPDASTDLPVTDLSIFRECVRRVRSHFEGLEA